ncbi:hypothetical protein [Rickettsiella endosymbiont of Dermanyssus gallinae]|uniref:hypothetical protein n=1 Tax=Rickettsiella endosymbiont of Dermanyssus gallinae TaxID=2856608 RepID=UPI001C52E386|nr:hypothetical protein [Rickettsiella endosymbiont of Dermanyssus gallinae]
MPRITNQIYSDGLRNRRSAEQYSGVGSFQLEDCFTGNIEEQCKINWDDVDEFNAEKEKNREFSEIKINSDEYLAFLKKDSSMPDAKLHQLIELVDKDSLKGTPESHK